LCGPQDRTAWVWRRENFLPPLRFDPRCSELLCRLHYPRTIRDILCTSKSTEIRHQNQLRKQIEMTCMKKPKIPHMCRWLPSLTFMIPWLSNDLRQ
jgi:hypothetical protein